MNNSIYQFDFPKNEPVKGYAPGSPERKLLREALNKMLSETVEIPIIIGGKEIKTGKIGNVVSPCDHKHVLATYHAVGEKEVKMAIDAAMEAHAKWEATPWVERASIIMKIAELIATKYRYIINAASMLGQGKNPMQAEIDSACETIDFLRFNSYYMAEIYKSQPISEPLVINRVEYRPLEGFVLAITPFNFTSIASNLCLSPALMGNTCVWKPSTTSLLSNYYLMKIYKEAGLPDGVVNFLPGSGSLIANTCLNDKDFAGVHFTGSTQVFNSVWRKCGENLEKYKSYPKLVGETGGKDFIVAHKSADAAQVATAIVRGAYEFQGQKCSAASRAYLPKTLWEQVKPIVGKMLSEIKVGNVTEFDNFVNAVIDEKSFDNCVSYIEHAKNSKDAEIVFGGTGDKSVGYFVQPTLILAKDPHYKSMVEEIFGPIMTVYVYDDDKFDEALELCDTTSPYALTGSIFCADRELMMKAFDKLRYAAGNFYINDKPTGAVVGQQPFGGSRCSGTNDKAGSAWNLLRWTSPRTIKENLVPPTNYPYPFLAKD